MPRIYSDYINRIALSLPDQFIDVRTGDVHQPSPKVINQIEYHSKNGTLVHLIYSALQFYLNPKTTLGSTNKILQELEEIKNMLNHGYSPPAQKEISSPQAARAIDLKELEDVLEAFGG
jgi:hypothetical protein